LNSNTPTKILRKRLPSPAERLSNPDALLSRTDLRELGLEAADAVKLERILREVAEREEAGGEYAGATSGGDARSLRGIPVVGYGCRSTMAGTDPLRALLAKERQR
jgi:hypothetical protein